MLFRAIILSLLFDHPSVEFSRCKREATTSTQHKVCRTRYASNEYLGCVVVLGGDIDGACTEAKNRVLHRGSRK